MTDGPRVICPATKGPWGVVTYTSGPDDSGGPRTEEQRQADALLRAGMVALDKRHRPRQLDRAEWCFREALYLLATVLEEPHPRISYALDRIGLTYHLQGRLREAEKLYVRSLAVVGDGERLTRWTEMTLINLRTLYGCQGRWREEEAVRRRYQENLQEE